MIILRYSVRLRDGFHIFCVSLFCFLLGLEMVADVPPVISYQGQISVDGVPFDGNGSFKFALVSANGENIYWNHDNSIILNLRPEPFDENAINLPVTNGVFATLLGHEGIENMQPIPMSVFAHSDVHLRVWFSEDGVGFDRLEPDQMIASVGYAMMAALVSDHAIGTSQLADGAVTTDKLATGSVASDQIADAAVTSSKLGFGSVSGDHIQAGTVGPTKLSQRYLPASGAALERDYIFRGANRSLIIENVEEDSFGLTLRPFGADPDRFGSISYSGESGNLAVHVNDDDVPALVVTEEKYVGLGTTEPLVPLYIEGDELGVSADSLNSEHMIVEARDARLALLSDERGSFGSMIGMKEIRRSSGALVDSWGIVRRTSGASTGSALEFRYGNSPQYHENDTLLRLGPGLEGDAALVVPNNSIGPAEMLGEVGLASGLAREQIQIRNNSRRNLVTRTINCPTDGFLLAIASCTARNVANDVTASFGILLPNLPLPVGLVQEFEASGNTLTGFDTEQHTIWLHEVLPIESGSQEVSFTVDFGGDLLIRGSRLTLMFIPSAYGVVD